MQFQLKVILYGIKTPPVWRRLLIPGSFTFTQIHNLLQPVFNWDGNHLHCFYSTISDNSIKPDSWVYSLLMKSPWAAFMQNFAMSTSLRSKNCM